jgi:murein DD-endopeptidase MepM/ murein hydrolase activator NlpD
MLTFWKHRKVIKRILLAVCGVVIINLANFAGIRYIREIKDAEIEKLETELMGKENDLKEAQQLYQDKLMDIVATVYEREFYSMGGYETPEGAGVTEVYEAIVNEIQDYQGMLAAVANYFDRRTEYLETIPTVWPIEYNEFTSITSGFGWRLSPFTGEVRFHSGLDISGVWDAKIIAPADGVVVEHWPAPEGYYQGHPNLGGMVKIEHAGGFDTVYGHMSIVYVGEGLKVKRGDVLGVMGDTGTSKGRHLHYELHHNGIPVNPIDYLQF